MTDVTRQSRCKKKDLLRNKVIAACGPLYLSTCRQHNISKHLAVHCTIQRAATVKSGIPSLTALSFLSLIIIVRDLANSLNFRELNKPSMTVFIHVYIICIPDAIINRSSICHWPHKPSEAIHRFVL